MSTSLQDMIEPGVVSNCCGDTKVPLRLSGVVGLIGQRFGRLAVIGIRQESDGRTFRAKCLCKCDCGKDHVTPPENLRKGCTRSCGCLREETRKKTPMTHGLSSTKEFRTWQGIISRCYNPNGKFYHNYGGRGITVCRAWRYDFTAFLNHVGESPSPKHSIDRIDNDGHYEPGNVRWSTRLEQAMNRRTNRWLEFMGVTLSITQWEEKLGFHQGFISNRLKRGWTVEEAISIPPIKPNGK